MKEIQINGKKYQCPESWDEITLEKQIEVNNYIDTFTNKSVKSIAMLGGYLGIPLDVLKKMKLSDANKLAKKVKFLNEKMPDKGITEFDFNGSHYYFGQNLMDVEFQDYVSIQNAMQNVSGDTLQVLPTLMAIMCKRKKPDGTLESLSDYDVDKRAEEFKKVPITVANSLSVFFYQNIITSQIISQLYSNPKEVAQKKIDECKNTIRSQAGRGLLMRWLRGTSLYYLKFIEKRLDKYFTS